jgi:hypothetical protein
MVSLLLEYHFKQLIGSVIQPIDDSQANVKEILDLCGAIC